MAATDAIIVSAICAAFIGYGLILAWGDFQTRNLGDRNASAGVKLGGDSQQPNSRPIGQGPRIVAGKSRLREMQTT